MASQYSFKGFLQESNNGIMSSISIKDYRLLSSLGQRATFGLSINEISKINKNLMIVTGDVSTSAGLDRFKKNYPEKYVDVGIAEQNLIGVATGLSSENFNVFTTTFSPFQTLRCCEQIKINLGYMKYNVKLVGLASGLALGNLGYTHCSIEDIGVLRSIPNLSIVSPADSFEVFKSVKALSKFKKPCYLRLTGNANLEPIYTKDYNFKIGKLIKIINGEDILIISNGAIISEVKTAINSLNKKGFYPELINMHTIKPIDKSFLKKISKFKMVITIEEHNIIGGLGSAISEVMAENAVEKPLIRLGINDKYSKSGDYNFLKKKFKIDNKNIERILIQNYEKFKKI